VPTGLEVLASDPDGVVAGFVIDLGDGNTTTALANGSFHEYAQPGTYLITVRAVDNLGASTEVTVPLVVLNRPPLARTDPPYVYADVGGQVKLDASASTDPEGGPLTFVWEFGDGATASGPSVVHTYGAPGIYTARLNVTDERAASSLVSVRVTVVPAPGGGTDVSGLLTAGLLASVVAAVIVYAAAARRRPSRREPDRAPEEERRPPQRP
jgi:PKD repeat protein